MATPEKKAEWAKKRELRREFDTLPGILHQIGETLVVFANPLKIMSGEQEIKAVSGGDAKTEERLRKGKGYVIAFFKQTVRDGDERRERLRAKLITVPWAELPNLRQFLKRHKDFPAATPADLAWIVGRADLAMELLPWCTKERLLHLLAGRCPSCDANSCQPISYGHSALHLEPPKEQGMRTYMVYNVAQCGPNYYGYQIREERFGVWSYWLHLDMWPVKPEYNDSGEYDAMSKAEAAARAACREAAIRDEERRAAQLAYSTKQPWFVVERPHPNGGCTIIACYSQEGWDYWRNWQPLCVNDPVPVLLAVVRPFVEE